MSWLADRNATTKAAIAVSQGSTVGSVWPMKKIAIASRICVSSSQLRRRPSRRVSTGSGTWSMIGDHRNLKV